MPRFILPAILFGAALVAFPLFFLHMVVFALIAGFAFRAVRRWSYGDNGTTIPNRWSHWQSRRLEFADRIRRMSDEEYKAFSQQSLPARIDSAGRNWGGSREDFVL